MVAQHVLDQRALCHDLEQYVAAAMVVATTPTTSRIGSEVRDRFDFIGRQLEHMHHLLQDCLEHPADDETADVVDLVRECVHDAAMHGHIDLDVEIPHAYLVGDHTALRRAVGNLLDNALRAAGEDGQVSVGVSASDSAVSIEVTDTGVGFGRLRSRHGLGMVSVADALDAFDGWLEIDSGPSRGTRVRLLLPRSMS